MNKITRKKQLKFLKKFATTNTVYDIGAGTNPPYRHLFPNRIRVDADASKKPDVVASIYNLPFKDLCCETILCLEVFEHLEDPVKAVTELKRVTKVGGLVLITTPFLFPLHNTPEDYWRITPYTLRNLFKGWEILEIGYQSEAFTSMGILLQRIGFQTELRGGKLTKALVYFTAWLFTKLDWLIVKQYGEINKTSEAEGVFSTGTYLVLRK